MGTKSNLEARNGAYANGSDFCRIFKEDMKRLYLLSLVLTADPVKAEQCFVSGLEDCTSGNQVFMEWAQSWTRRAIIQNAIRLLAPRAAESSNRAVSNSGGGFHPARAELRAELAPILELADFERFAFVLSVLERYSDHECALLLGCTRHALAAARTRALEQVTRPVGVQREKESDSDVERGTLLDHSNSSVPLAASA